MPNPTVSIIAPVYKAEPYLERCLQSVLAQSFTDFELILVDDGSPDRSGEICDQYAGLDARIKVIHQPNGGVGRARNNALAAASGRFIAYIDSDDYIGPDYLLHLIEAQKLHDADMTISRYNRRRESNEKFEWISPPRGERYFERADFGAQLPELFRDIRIGSLWNKLFKAELLRGLEYATDAKISGDVVLVCEVLGRTRSIQLTDASDYYYIERTSGSITSQNNPVLYLEYLKAQHRIIERLEQNGWMTPDMRLAMDERMVRYLTRSIHSIRRGSWRFAARRDYIRELLANPDMAQTASAEYDRSHRREFALMSRNRPARLMLHYALNEHKRKLLRKLPGGMLQAGIRLKRKLLH